MCNDCDTYFTKKINVRKEHKVKNILLNKYKEPQTCDKIPEGSCDKYRPDFVWDNGLNITILEVDENAHRTYACECEQARMVNISQDFGGIPVIWVRFNPDSYTDNFGKKHRGNINSRMDKVVEVLKNCEEYRPIGLMSIIYMYYDGYKVNVNNVDNISLECVGL